ncbi:MAG: hypothetical protein LBH86_00200 [Oscillospiraceae bacterium]|nr:hypothetical protein [Oscillospiraceae bacterium]
MSRRKKYPFLIIGIIILVIVGTTIAVKFYLSAKEQKAIQIAQEYLVQKYEQEMRYESVRYSWIDPAIYHVHFSLVSNPDMAIEVMVQDDLSLREPRSSGDYDYMPDNYYIACFEFEMGKYFRPDTKRIWGEGARTHAMFFDPALYAFGVPHGLNNRLTLEDMAALVDDYHLVVRPNVDFEDELKMSEADKILDFIQTVQGGLFKPSRISFLYNIPETKNNKDGLISIGFDDWIDINMVEQVMRRIETELANG